MANKLYVAEFPNAQPYSGSQASEALPSPALAMQVVTIAAAPGNVSVAFNAKTKMIAVTADTACCVRITSPRGAADAAATDLYIPANAAPIKFAVTPDMGISACTP